ncbi:MAG: hypothetical protein JF614_25205 [Acidobacteria bacterium]|nr:hypothetical protein [Acidobacteriota bacterium]
MERLKRFAAPCLIVALLGCLGIHAESHPKVLRLLQRLPLPPAGSIATDVRWASDDSVFIAWDRDGVAEVGLDGIRRRTAVPDVKTFGRFDHYHRLAVSPRFLAVSAGSWYLAWRPRKSETEGRIIFQRAGIGLAKDMDLQGDRLLLLGTSGTEHPTFSTGAVAWLGTLTAGLDDLKPVLYDDGGPGAPHLSRCIFGDLGAVRFLGDGSFVIVPGFQKGVYLFAANGQRIRSWTSEEVGLNTDCSGLSDEEEAKLRMDPATWQRWLSAHHVLDDILPLSEGPGLLVRSVGRDGLARWELKVLAAGRVKTYTVPVVGTRPFDRLHGDVRNGRIVLLLSGSGFPVSMGKADNQGEILLTELPSL